MPFYESRHLPALIMSLPLFGFYQVIRSCLIRCLQEADLSVVAAQAAAQVERARQAVKKQAQAALFSKPKLQLHVTLDAPKVAVPIPAAPGSPEGAQPLQRFPRICQRLSASRCTAGSGVTLAPSYVVSSSSATACTSSSLRCLACGPPNLPTSFGCTYAQAR